MSKKHHHQGQVGMAEVPVTEPETKVDLAEAQKEQDAQIEADLNEVAETVEAEVEAKENPAGFKARMKALKEQQKKEMAQLKEELKAEKEKNKAEGKVVTKGASPDRFTMTTQFVMGIEQGMKFDDLAIKSDETYVAANANGHKSNVREARAVAKIVVKVLSIAGDIKIEGDLISRTISA